MKRGLRIAVIGANGQSGRAFVRVALEAGHEVTAGVRDVDSMKKRPHLKVVKCDAMKAPDVQKLVDGHDVVVSLIGHVKGSPADLHTTSTIHVVEAMKKHGVKRVVTLTGTGVRMPGDQVTLADRLITLGVRIIDPERIRDSATHIKVLEDSGLDWTVIRVSKLFNTEAKPYRLASNGPVERYTSREEVAFAILEVVEKDKCIRDAPMMSPFRA